MKKKSLMIGCVALLAAFGSLTGAVAQTLPDLNCETDSGPPITITYGFVGAFSQKTIFEVKETVDVKRGKGLIFRLKARDGGEGRLADIKDAMVRIKGKRGSEWFTLIQGSYNGTAGTDHKIGICADTQTGTYEYEISIEGFGMLDPRVIVKN